MCSIKPYALHLTPHALGLNGPSVATRKKLLQITATPLLDGLVDLTTHGLLKSPVLDVPENPNGFRKLWVTHTR